MELNFSKRGDALIGQEMFRLLDLSKKIELEGKKIYHLELGDPKNYRFELGDPKYYRGAKNYPPGRVINKTIVSLLNSDVGYASSGGLTALRQKLSEYLSKKFGKGVGAENVVISTANMLIFQILDIVCEKSDAVAVFTPAFPSYIATCGYVGVSMVKVPLSAENGFNLTKRDIDKAFSSNPKLIFVNSGNNPTGAVYDEEVLRYLLERAKKRDCWIISDETYGMLSYDKKYFSMANLDYEKLVVISSFSKVFNIPGFRIGYAIADPRVARKISLSTSTLYSCLPLFTQEGVLEGIPVMDAFAEDRMKYYKKLCKQCTDILSRSKYISCTKPVSAFYLFIDIRKLGIDDKLFCSNLLEEYRTVVTPGASFGWKGFIRASFCGAVDDVKKGLKQIVSYADFLGRNLRKKSPPVKKSRTKGE